MNIRSRVSRLGWSSVRDRGSIIEILEPKVVLSTVQVQGHAAITAKYAAMGGASSFLGQSTGTEALTTNGNGLYQYYQGGMIVWSAATGAHEVHGAIINRYNELGATSSYLGFPIADEMYTPQFDGRVSKFEKGTIVYTYATGVTTDVSNSIPPTIDVLTPPNFREGDVFTVTVMNAVPGQLVRVAVIGDGNRVEYQFSSVNIDSNGNTTLALRMPYVLGNGITVDGRTIRVTTVDYAKDFHITFREGQRIGLSTDNVQEGKAITVTIRNGMANSQDIIQLTKDSQVVHEWGYMQTDGSGNGRYVLIIPNVLSGSARVDAFGLRVIHGGVVTEKKITITEGFRVELGAKKVRETVSDFPMGIRNATPNATVTLWWYLDNDYRATQTFRTNGSGDGNFTVHTPKLIKNSAGEDTFRIVVWVSGQSATFEFKMLVLKYAPSNHSVPDPGGSQSQTAAPAPKKINSAPGVTFNTPATNAVTNERPITKTENPTLAAEDPVITVQKRMEHQLVILCYGAGQRPGDANSPGMDQVYDSIQGVSGRSHVVRLWSGDKSLIPKENLISAEQATREAKQAISETLNLLRSLGQSINSVVLAGYSWGGGMALELANWITSTYHIEISGLVYIDAVVHGLISYQTQLPVVNPSSFLNVYESIHTPLEHTYLEGSGHVNNSRLIKVNDNAAYGQYEELDTDAFGINVADHVNIDRKEKNLVSEFIDSVLYGWYGTHRS